MQNDEKIFLSVLSSYINKNEISESGFKDINWEHIYHLANIHNIVGILLVGLNTIKIDLPENYRNKMYDIFLATSVFSVKQEQEAERIIKCLNENKIWHLMTKGYIIKNYYANKELRTMGDIDIFVKKEDFQRTINILKKEGYQVTDSYFNEVSFDKNGVHFEIHDNLLNENLGNDYEYGEYFEKLSKNAKLINDYTYEFDTNDHLIYLIAHIAKHFYNEGCGIRMIMDVAVYIKYFEYELDWNYLWGEFEKIELKKFAENILYICKYWFCTNIDVPEMDEILYSKVEKYILEAGTFGFYERNIGTKLLRKSYGNGVSGGVLRWFFPSEEDMRELSEWFKHKHKYLLPLAWIKRWFDAALQKRGTVFHKTLGVLGNKKEAEKQYEMLRKLGIYQAKKNS